MPQRLIITRDMDDHTQSVPDDEIDDNQAD